MSIVISDVHDLEQILKEKRIVIYGAGYVAERFCMILKERELLEKVVCFVTTKGENKKICDFPVIAVEQLEEDEQTVICVAVHEAIRNEIFKLLESRGMHNYIWIYPYLYELLLGEPINKEAIVPLTEILMKESQYYGVTVRYLAIEQYYNKNKLGYDIYTKAWSVMCDFKTAEARLDKFKGLIKNLEQNGYDEKKPIKILKNGEIIDGIHRLAVAVYEKKEYMICDVYNEPKKEIKVHTDKIRMTDDSIKKAGFTHEEANIVEETRRRINGQYLIY